MFLIQKAVPHWGDRHDILSLLRACNYDPDECISIYTHLERDGKPFHFLYSDDFIYANMRIAWTSG